MFERSSKQKFMLAQFILGHLEEKNGCIKKSIDYYLKALEYENEPLVFQGVTYHDEQLKISTEIISCFLNFKFVDYYISNNLDQAKKYFTHCFNKFNKFSVELKNEKENDLNIFSSLKSFIFGYSKFYLVNQPNFYLELGFLKDLNQTVSTKQISGTNDNKKTTSSSDIISINKYNNTQARSYEIKSNTSLYYDVKLNLNLFEGNIFNCFDPKKDEQEKLVFKDPEHLFNFALKKEETKKKI